VTWTTLKVGGPIANDGFTPYRMVVTVVGFAMPICHRTGILAGHGDISLVKQQHEQTGGCRHCRFTLRQGVDEAESWVDVCKVYYI
jgi:hypothetical protein